MQSTVSWLVLSVAAITCAGCAICVNGRGIGCAGPTYPTEREFEQQQEKRQAELRRQLDTSFLMALTRAAGAHAEAAPDHYTPDLSTTKERREVAAVLERMSEELTALANRHDSDEAFRSYFGFPRQLPRVHVVVGSGLVPTVNCDGQAIDVPDGFVRTLLEGGVQEGVRGDLSTPVIPDGVFYPGSVHWKFPESGLEELTNRMAVVNTAEWRTLAFVLAHESAHIWAQQCVASANSDVQKTRESKADLLATIIASELYAASCLNAPLLVSPETFAEMTAPDGPKHDDVGELVADRMDEMHLNRFLVAGGGDVEFLFTNFEGKLTAAEQAHPIPGARVSVDLRLRKLIVRQFYNQVNKDLNKSFWTVLLPKDVREDMPNFLHDGLDSGFIGISYQEYLTKSLLTCSAATFENTVRRIGGSPSKGPASVGYY